MFGLAGESAMNADSITKEAAEQIATAFLRKTKSPERVQVSKIEFSNDVWIIRGICPISLEGHPWVEKFVVVLDNKGNVKTTSFGLL